MRCLSTALALTLALGACGAAEGWPPSLPLRPSVPEGSPSIAACDAHRAGVLAGLSAPDRARADMGLSAGHVAGLAPAAAHVEARTGGGYTLRSVLSIVFASLAFVILGALVTAALVGRFVGRKGGHAGPSHLRHARLAERLTEAVAALRGTPAAASVMGALVAHFEDVLTLATARAEALAARGRALAAEEVPTTGPMAPLAEQAEIAARLEGLLGTVERLHVELLAWCDLADPDATLRDVVARRLETLRQSLEAIPSAAPEVTP